MAAVAGAGTAVGRRRTRRPSTPTRERAGYADPDSRAARAAAEAKAQGNTDEQAVFDRLAQTPTGIWLTPEEYPPGEVGPFVTKIVDGADGAGQVPTFVVYGIP